jgi:hypothetical protein
MPPKRNTTARPSGTAKRGRANAGRRSKSVKDHVRVLSDISEESISQRPAAKEIEATDLSQRITRSSKKRSFQEFTDVGDEGNSTQPARKNKQERNPTLEQATQQSTVQSQDQGRILQQVVYQDTPAAGISSSSSSPPYSPSLNLLFFVQLASLDTDDDTERLTLNLIKLTLADMNWHPGLSGMVQPVACFLAASMLTRKQNLVEDIASSIETFWVGFEELMEGYALLWKWRANMRDAVGFYAERLDALPEPSSMIAQGYHDQNETDGYEQDGEMDERPEPERWDGVFQV